jgi:hypothetical protein
VLPNRSAEGQRRKSTPGRNRRPFNWENLKAQSLLGVEGFAEGLRHLVTEKQRIRETPKRQRFVGRRVWRSYFHISPGKASRDHLAGYSQMEVASCASTIRRSAESSQPTEAQILKEPIPCLSTLNVNLLMLQTILAPAPQRLPAFVKALVFRLQIEEDQNYSAHLTGFQVHATARL